MRFPQYGRVPAELLRDPSMSAGAIRLFAMLDDYADRDSGVCWPSIETLMEGMGVARKTIKRALTELIEAGWIEREERFNGKRQSSNRYIVHGAKRGVTSDPGEGVTSDPQNQNQKEPKPSSVKKRPNRRKKTTLKPPDEAIFEAWWKDYPRKVNKAGARTSWVAVIGSGKTEELTLALANYNASVVASGTEYVMHPTTFLNGRWEDFSDGENFDAWMRGAETEDEEWTEW